MSDMIKGYNASDELVYAGVNDNHELEIDSRHTVNRDTILDAAVIMVVNESQSSAVINLDTLKFKREYKGLSIQVRLVDKADASTVITASIDFYNTSGGTSYKTVSSAMVLNTANQVEVYHVLPDDMSFKYMKLTLTDASSAGAHSHCEAFLVY